MNAHLTTLGVGAVVVVLQLYLIHRCRRTKRRGVATATASLGILIAVALLETGHSAQRTRAARHESLEALQLHDRPAAVAIDSVHGGEPFGQVGAAGHAQLAEHLAQVPLDRAGAQK
ncbi:hypothetical protein [Actinoplanes solisilvae]|uniref:hypothetical protein n=1 Tax=Actinoplanes solisilvae TaxID=2486853 RepID=UPI00196B31EF|nr:hypothetical protein [Actinoplanes solisilvae]